MRKGLRDTREDHFASVLVQAARRWQLDESAGAFDHTWSFFGDHAFGSDRPVDQNRFFERTRRSAVTGDSPAAMAAWTITSSSTAEMNAAMEDSR